MQENVERLSWRRRVWRRMKRTGETGQGLAEYALILAFVALVCIAALGALGSAIANSPGFNLL